MSFSVIVNKNDLDKFGTWSAEFYLHDAFAPVRDMPPKDMIYEAKYVLEESCEFKKEEMRKVEFYTGCVSKSTESKFLKILMGDADLDSIPDYHDKLQVCTLILYAGALAISDSKMQELNELRDSLKDKLAQVDDYIKKIKLNWRENDSTNYTQRKDKGTL